MSIAGESRDLLHESLVDRRSPLLVLYLFSVAGQPLVVSESWDRSSAAGRLGHHFRFHIQQTTDRDIVN